MDHHHCAAEIIRSIPFCLVAFLMFVVVVVVLSLVHILCRRNRSPDIEAPPETRKNDHQDKHDDELAGLPVFSFGTDGLYQGQPLSPTQEEPRTCAICLDEYVQGDCLRMLPRCRHIFHKDCIDMWLLSRSLRCPICRGQALNRNVESTGRSCGDAEAGLRAYATFPPWTMPTLNAL